MDRIFTALFPNNRKEKETHPDYKMKWSKEEGLSTVNLEAGEYEIAIWKKTSAAGNQYLSLGLTKIEPKPQSEPSEAKSPDGDDIPF